MSESTSSGQPDTTSGGNPKDPTVALAKTPFDDSDADFIVRTSDHVEFRVYRVILALASSIFKGMFPIPQPPDMATSVSAVDVTEDSRTMDTFLRICYPLVDPEVDSLSHLRKVLEAGVKYDTAIVTTAMKKAMVQPRFIDKKPLAVFAAACSLELEEEARAAAEKAVILNCINDDSAELDEISAGAYFRLLQFKRSSRRNAKSKKGSRSIPTATFAEIDPFCRPNHSLPKVALPIVTLLDAFRDPYGDVILRTDDMVDFRVHRTIVDLASQAFLRMLVRETLTQDRAEGGSIAPVFFVPESSAVLDHLLRLCYPVKYPDLAEADVFLAVLRAACKYKFHKAIQILRNHWSTFAEKQPLRFYFAAVECGWRKEGESCALIVAQEHSLDIETLYIPEMEHIGSLPYRRLLAYAQACCAAVAAAGARTISGLPGRVCPASNNCHERYPTAFAPSYIDSNTPRWLREGFLDFERVLRFGCHSKKINPGSALGSSFIAAAGADHVHCQCAVKTSEQGATALVTALGRVQSPRCTVADNAQWALALLTAYARAVDGAVQAVKLEMTVAGCGGTGEP